MQKTNKLSNLYRLNAKSALLVLVYLFKKVLRIKVSSTENETYILYNYLLKNDGYLKEENTTSYTCIFKKNREKKIILRKNPSSDLAVFNQVYGWLEYQKVVETYKNSFNYNPENEINIIDAGSNIGLTSLYFLDYFKQVNLISVEPEKENFKVLQANLQNLPKQFQTQQINGGIWSSDTFLKIVSDFRDQSDWSFRVEETNNPNDIKAYSISSLLKSNNWNTIDILKIDIEGSEKQIFDVQNSDVSFLSKTKCIAIEIHDEFNCREMIYQVLSDFNFTYFNNGELTIGVNQNFSS